MTPFHVGMKVVRISESPNKFGCGIETFPNVGCTYTIRSMEKSNAECGCHLLLVEIVNPVLHYSDGLHEVAFNGDRFRPVTKTSIDIFTAMLAPAPKQRVEA